MRAQRWMFAFPAVFSSLSRRFHGILRVLPATMALATLSAAAQTQGSSVADSAGPRVIVPSKSSPQFFVLNANGSLTGYSTVNPTSFALGCGTPQGVSVASSSSLTLTIDDRQTTAFQTGLSSQGPVAVGRGTPFSGSNCANSPSVALGNSTDTVQFSVEDPAHQRLFVLSTAGLDGNFDSITSFSTANVMYGSNSNALSTLGHANLDSGGTYTSLVTDVDGNYGDTIATELRTDSKAGGLWLYNSSFTNVRQILGPGGVALPAVGAFIIHNPTNGGGNLLVLVNQDGLTSSNITSPPLDTTAFTIIDLGQLHDLLNLSPTASTITLPSVVTIHSSLGYYSMLGATYDPVSRLLYAVVGGGTSLDNLYREVVSYDPYNPSAPAETVVADVSSVPLTSPLTTKLALNSASLSMQILAQDAGQVFTVSLAGTAGTATPVIGDTFNDTNFQPTYIAANPLLGETYIASTGQVDVITRPAAAKMHLDLDLTGPETQAAVGNNSSIRLLVNAPDTTGLSSTDVTITATPQDGSASFTFATKTASSALMLPTSVSGSFANPGIYSLVASFPGNSAFAPATSSPVVVAVAQALFPTQTNVTGSINTSTGAAHAVVTLTGTTYTPTGKIMITSVNSGLTLLTYSIPQTGPLSNPIALAFTAPPSTTAIKASYSGDALNQASISAAATLTTLTTVVPTIVVTAPATATAGLAVPLNVKFQSTSTTPPTGSITLNTGDGHFLSLGAADAFAPAGATLNFTYAAAGNYTVTASFFADANYANATGTATLTVASASLLTLSPTSLSITVAAGSKSTPSPVVLTNTGTASFTITNIATTGTGFSQTSDCASTLAAQAHCTISVTYQSTVGGTFTGDLAVSTSAASTQHVSLNATAQGPAANVGISSKVFPDLTLGTTVVTPTVVNLRNSGTQSLSISSIVSNNTADFEVSDIDCFSKNPLPALASCTVALKFHPSAAGLRSGTIRFTTSDTVSPQTIAVSGNGLASGACKDSDSDGLCDDWEINGVMVRTTSGDKFVDLPTMGANPMHKDIFLHIDYMVTDSKATGAHTHKPKLGAMLTLQTLFDNAPIVNVDGTKGIHLHIDCGSDCVMNPSSQQTWGSLSKANALSELETLNYGGPKAPAPPNFDWTNFDTASATFKATGRALVFHHVIFAHNLWQSNSTSGLSRNASDLATFRLGASDLVVSLGLWTNSTGTDMEQAGTLMHELGHNLGLEHGGRDELNYKPNHFSVMNYNFQTRGMILEGKQNQNLDYSEFANPAISEQLLDETKGIASDPKVYLPSGGPTVDRYGTYEYCPGSLGGRDNPVYTNFASKVDWNCSKAIDTLRIKSDINGDGSFTSLSSVQEWPILVYSGGAVGGNGADALMQTSSDEITMERDALIPSLESVSVSGANIIQTAPGSTTTLRFVVKNTSVTPDTYNLSASSNAGWANTSITPATVTLDAGASAVITVSYTVPVNAAEGDSDKLTFSAGSQTSPNVIDTAEVALYATTSPAPFAVSTSTVLFGNQTPGSSSATSPVVITNTGTASLNLASIAASAEFSQSNTCGGSLAVGASCVVNVTFTPAALGTRTGSLTVNSATINLSGTAVSPPLALPAVSLSATPAATSTGQTITLSANVAATPAGAVPTGTVTFFNDTTQIGQATLDGSGNAVFTSSTLGAGTYNVLAEYSGDTTFRVADSPYQSLIIVAATPTTATLTTSAAAVASGASVTFTATLSGGTTGSQPTGSVQFLDATSVLGTGVLNANGVATFTTSSLANGSHNITVVYGGDAVFGASTSTALLETVGTFATTTVLTTTASPVVTGTSVTLTGTVSSATGTPGGTVTFVDGTTTLGTGTLNASGVATYSTSSLAIGTHSITAQYAATGNYGASISAAKQIVVTAVPDYSVTANPTALTVTSGTTGAVTFTVTPVNGYANTINFSCGTLPSYASCSFVPAKLTFTAAAQTAQTTTLTISTTQSQAAVKRFSPWNQGETVFAFVLPLALFGLGRRRRNPFRTGLLLLVLSAAGLMALSGCAGSTPSAPATTPAGTYSVPITISDGTTNHSITYSVTVK